MLGEIAEIGKERANSLGVGTMVHETVRLETIAVSLVRITYQRKKIFILL